MKNAPGGDLWIAKGVLAQDGIADFEQGAGRGPPPLGSRRTTHRSTSRRAYPRSAIPKPLPAVAAASEAPQWPM